MTGSDNTPHHPSPHHAPGPPTLSDTGELPAVELPDPATRPPPCEPPYLEAHGLTATGPAGPVYRDVDLTAARGELVALVGDSGSGKTSLLLTLAGRFRHRRGHVSVGGDRRPEAIRRKVAVAAAAPAVTLDPHHTVGELITETILTGCPATRDNLRRVWELLGVDAHTGTRCGDLAPVDRTLLALAFAAAARTPVIAVDDVDAGLGGVAAARVWAALRLLADQDHVVIATAVRPDLTPDVVVRLHPATGGLPRPHGVQAHTVVTRVVGREPP
ncbi:ABC transporter family protein [Stackebrandtia albiflava]|uniref:ABC transporter family protein n=1 Tax=Stackebrandtia albiflava TaxID=406432 RepID=A0A562ULD1_9ACTN|nr:ATP-binding cassette domain-containing protein [Stackebrandtia albiflava]TWJ06431.1 ABC transporter family protein [Stackebrandtia albiflava]